MSIPASLLALILAGLVLWQLVSGKALDRSWRPSVSRQDNPGIYWFVIVVQSAMLIVVLITGKTSWHFSQSKHESAPASSSSRQPSSPAQQGREKALALHRAGSFAEAIAAYDELLQESDGDAELHFWRAMAHWKLEQTDLALQDFRRVIELEPANFEAYRSADRILSRQQRWDEVLEMWDSFIERAPENAEAYFERGGTNFHKGNLAAAEADAAKACELGKAEACALAERLKSKP